MTHCIHSLQAQALSCQHVFDYVPDRTGEIAGTTILTFILGKVQFAII